MNKVNIRKTLDEDITYVMVEEQKPENAEYVLVWTRGQHLDAIQDSNQDHLIVEEMETGSPVGYILLSGLNASNHAIELRRIVISEKGKGYGRQAIQLVKKYAFETLKAHRLWLDVKVYNDIAQKLYQSEGFVKEGVMRESLYADGEYFDMVLMAMVEGDYVAWSSS